MKNIISKVDRGILVILSLPWLILAVNSAWIFTPVNTIDPWVYFGYFLNLSHHLKTFVGTYYGTRLSWIVPGYLTYKIFPPLIANYILHLGFYYAAVISIYLILKNTIGYRTALFSAILMGCHSFFLSAIGWDYVDGAGITYYLLTMLMLTYAAKLPHWRFWICLSGVFYGAVIYSNLFWITFTPSLAIYYTFINRDNSRKSIYISILLFVLGLFFISGLLGIINASLTGEFLFFLPSVKFASAFVQKANPWQLDYYKWIVQASWLMIPSVTFICSLLSILLSRINRSISIDRASLVLQLPFIINCLTMIFFELKGQPVLQHSFYTSYLIPSMFVSLASQSKDAVNSLTNRRLFIVISIAIFSLLFLLKNNTKILEIVSSPALIVVVGLIGCLLISLRLQKKVFVILCLGLTFSFFSFVTFDKSDSNIKKNDFLTVAKSVKAIQAIVPPKVVLKFWYDAKSPYGGIYRAVSSSYLWGYSLINENFPALGDLAGNPTQLTPDTTVVILSQKTDIFEKANDSLKQMGLEVQILSKQIIQQQQIKYTMNFVKTKLSSK